MKFLNAILLSMFLVVSTPVQAQVDWLWVSEGIAALSGINLLNIFFYRLNNPPNPDKEVSRPVYESVHSVTEKETGGMTTINTVSFVGSLIAIFALL